MELLHQVTIVGKSQLLSRRGPAAIGKGRLLSRRCPRERTLCGARRLLAWPAWLHRGRSSTRESTTT